ncbi:MAG: YidC/Oxa1 family insertase periplasmic-domain containing protein [bacterium]
MEKRLPLFFLLSFLILVMWPTPPEPKVAPRIPMVLTPDFPPGMGPAIEGVSPATQTRPDKEAEPWRETLRLGTPGEPGYYLATFDSRGGVLSGLRLGGFYTENGLDPQEKENPLNWVQLLSEVNTPSGVQSSLGLHSTSASEEMVGFPLDQVHWQHEVLEEFGRTVGVQFSHDTGRGLSLTKTLRVNPNSYDLTLDIELRNSVPEWAGRQPRLIFTPALGMPASADDSYYEEPRAGVSWEQGDELEVERQELSIGEQDGESFPPTRDILWAGMDSKFFAVLARPDDATRGVVTGAGWRTLYDLNWVAEHPMDPLKSIEDNKENDPVKGWRHVTCDLDLTAPLPGPQGVSRMTFEIYAGPKSSGLLEDHDPALLSLVAGDLGFFSGIASTLLAILGFFHGIVGNWGWSIICLTLTVRLALFPFNRRSQTSMARHAKKMKRVQPMLNELKEKYKDNPQKQRSEQARIMQEEGAFPPLGGCLPIFVQIPIFFGLFKALRVSFDLRQAPFIGWVKDLSEPDRLMRLDWDLPLLGTVEYLNILPPMMVFLWILQQKVMPKPTDEQALKMQKMMMWMPIVFGFFLYNYQSGLSLYMITTSLFGVLEQTVIKKIWPIDDSEQPKKKSGFMARMAEMQKQAQKMQEMQKAEKKRAQHKGKRKKR